MCLLTDLLIITGVDRDASLDRWSEIKHKWLLNGHGEQVTFSMSLSECLNHRLYTSRKTNKPRLIQKLNESILTIRCLLAQL